MEWLSGRTAAKDAVRSFLKSRQNLTVLPADITISSDEQGKPLAGGAWVHHVQEVPEISITHSGGTAVALVGQGKALKGVGIDLQLVRELEASFEGIAFSAEEQELLTAFAGPLRTEWMLRPWCAKEAVAKALGRGLLAGPSSVRILSLHASTGKVLATPSGQLAREFPNGVARSLVAHTAREGQYIVATSTWEGANL